MLFTKEKVRETCVPTDPQTSLNLRKETVIFTHICKLKNARYAKLGMPNGVGDAERS